MSPRHFLLLGALLAALGLMSCGDDGEGGDELPARTTFRAQHMHTLRLGANDNAEVVKAIPGQPRALLVSSKARKVTLLQVGADRLESKREAVLFAADATESELTHVDVSSDGSWAVLTRTIIETDADGAQTSCGGELVFIDASDADTFGTILAQVAVGPMPDSVDISDDDLWVASANERDGPDAWGKCEVPDAQPSISLVDTSGGPAAAVEAKRVLMVDGDTGPREPESVTFGADDDLVVATLQDSHEVALLSVSAMQALDAPTSADLTIVALPANALGAKPWPDGVARFVDGGGAEYFAVAGEWNDTFSVLDPAGAVVATVEVSAADIPESFPRVVEADSPLFSPDSVAAFQHGGRSWITFSLRHAGALATYDVTDVSQITFGGALAVGDSEQGGQDEDGSTIRPEGVAAAADGSFVLSANEEESSVSLVVPVD